MELTYTRKDNRSYHNTWHMEITEIRDYAKSTTLRFNSEAEFVNAVRAHTAALIMRAWHFDKDGNEYTISIRE